MYAPRSPRAWQTRNIDSSNSLEHQLHELTETARGLSRPYHGLSRVEQVEDAEGVQTWLERNPTPPLRDDYQAIGERGGDKLAVVGLLPRGLPVGIAIHAMKLGAYWPLVYTYPDQWTRGWSPAGVRRIDSPELQFELGGYESSSSAGLICPRGRRFESA